MTLFPVRRESVSDALVQYLANVFNDTVEDGRTYPQQEKLTLEQFVRFASSTLALNFFPLCVRG